MAKISLTNLSSPYIASGVTTYNSNLAALRTAIENTLSRDGTSPNQMEADLDLNNNDLLNVGTIDADTFILNGEALVPADLAVTDASLLALSALTPAANKFPYFTSGSAAALADITSAGRALLDDTNADAQLTTLGGGAAGIAALKASNAETLRKRSAVFDSVSDLLADTTLAYSSGTVMVSSGDVVEAGGYRYTVAASGASDHHLITAGSVKLYVAPLDGRYDAEAFGVKGDDSTLNTTTMQKWLDAASGYEARIGVGTFQTGALTPPSNTRIVGAGRNCTIIKVAASAGHANLITHTNKTGLSIIDVGFYGNNGGNAHGNGEVIRVILDGSATADATDYEIIGCGFDNFCAASWITGYVSSTSYAIRRFRVKGNTFKSSSGNCRDGTLLGVQSSFISLGGSLGSGGTYLYDLEVDSNIADGTYIKRFCDFWGGSRRFSCTNNKISNFGADASISVDSGVYGIMAYDSLLTLGFQDGLIANNEIINTKAVGIYLAAGHKIIIANNTIRGITATSEVTLPRGGIALNSCFDMTVIGNRIEDSGTNGIRASGLSSWTGTNSPHTDTRVNINILNNVIFDCDTSGILLDGDITAVGTTTGGLTCADNTTYGFAIKGNTIVNCMRGVYFRTWGPNCNEVTISDNEITSTVAGSLGISTEPYAGGALGTAGLNTNELLIARNRLNTIAYGAQIRTVLGSATVMGNVFKGDFTGRGLDATSCEQIAIIGNVFHDFSSSSAACLNTASSKGEQEGNRFVDVYTGKIFTNAIDMGYTTPTWTPTGRNSYVQALNAVETGTAGSKYVILGFYYDGSAWRHDRRLTGN